MFLVQVVQQLEKHHWSSVPLSSVTTTVLSLMMILHCKTQLCVNNALNFRLCVFQLTLNTHLKSLLFDLIRRYVDVCDAGLEKMLNAVMQIGPRRYNNKFDPIWSGLNRSGPVQSTHFWVPIGPVRSILF